MKPKRNAGAVECVVRLGVVCVNSWAGRIEHQCRIVRETPKRYLIEVDVLTKLPGTWLEPGQQRLVPKSAVRIHEA